MEIAEQKESRHAAVDGPYGAPDTASGSR
jgi:hypothetical protein